MLSPEIHLLNLNQKTVDSRLRGNGVILVLVFKEAGLGNFSI
jgi:hypothetical protein